MADINSKSAITESNADGSPMGGREPVVVTAADSASTTNDLVKFVELLFFAYRDFTGDADELLDDLGYGRAHHRVIHFVARHPGLRVADLLEILRITKQSLARVLKQLIDEGFVSQKSGETDRRERHLYLTMKGLNFAEKLSQLQCARIGGAFEKIGPKNKETIEAFLFAMISAKDQVSVAALVEKADENDDNRRAERDDQTCPSADDRD